MMQTFSSLLGCAGDSPAVKTFTSSFQPSDAVERGGSFVQSYPADGLELAFGKDSRLISVSLFSPGFQGHDGYKGKLPNELRFSDSRDLVRSKLGKPHHCFEPKAAKNAMLPSIDRFDFSDCSLHVQYGGDEIVQRLVVRPKAD